jgi:hypothetical protein
LLHYIAGAVSVEMNRQGQAAASLPPGVPEGSWPPQERLGSTRVLVTHLHSCKLRLVALQLAAAELVSSPGQHPLGAAALAAAVAAAGAAVAGGISRTTATPVPPQFDMVGASNLPGGPPTWCPAHSSCAAPLLVHRDTVGTMCWAQLLILLGRDTAFVLGYSCSNLAQQSLGCGHIGCGCLEGPSEAGRVVNQKGVLCRRCGTARFCSPLCAQLAWPLHSKACGRLAAARRRRTGGSSSSSSHEEAAGSTAGGGGGVPRQWTGQQRRLQQQRRQQQQQ